MLLHIKRSNASVALLTLLWFTVAANAAVHRVEQDGSGEFLSISEAVTVASALDTILVGPGNYAESIQCTKSLSLVSTDGAEATVLDGLNTFRSLLFEGELDAFVRGFTFTRGYHPDVGGSITARFAATLAVEECRFIDNATGFDAGSVHVRHLGSRIRLTDCLFADNSTVRGGGAVSTILNSTMEIIRCRFERNSSELQTGAVSCFNSELYVSNSLFVDNDAPDTGAIHLFESTGLVEYSTFHGNSSPAGGSILVNASPNTEIRGNIFSNDVAGAGVCYQFSIGDHSCNLFWDNLLGPVTGDGLDPTEVEMDPQFCQASSGDFSISFSSPASSLCGARAGAFDPACDKAAPLVELSLARRGAAIGEIVEVPLTIAFPDPGKGDPSRIAGLDLTVSWSPQVARLSDILQTDATSAWLLASNGAEGSLTISMVGLVPLPLLDGPVTALNLQFEVLVEEGATDLELSDTSMFDLDVQPVAHRTLDGSLIAGCTAGDVNSDGSINSGDALLTLLFAAELRIPTSVELCSADLNEDGEATVGDAILVLRRAVGLPKIEVASQNARLEALVTSSELQLTLTGAAGLYVMLRPGAGVALGSPTAGTGLLVPVSHDGHLALYFADAIAEPVQLRVPLSGVLSPGAVEIVQAVAYGESGREVGLDVDVSTVTTAPPIRQGKLSLQAVPNPFNPLTEFHFVLERQAVVRATLFDGAGRTVLHFDPTDLMAGEHRLRWDATDSNGNRVASGTYWMLLQAGDVTATRAITLLK